MDEEESNLNKNDFPNETSAPIVAPTGSNKRSFFSKMDPSSSPSPPKVFTFATTAGGSNRKTKSPSFQQVETSHEPQQQKYYTDSKDSGVIPGTISILKKQKSDHGIIGGSDDGDAVGDKNDLNHLNTTQVEEDFNNDECDTPVIRNSVAGSVAGYQDSSVIEGVNKSQTEPKDESCTPSSPTNKIIEINKKKEEKTTNKGRKINCPFFDCQNFIVIIYLATYGIFGSTLRIFLGRIFGYDCENPGLFNDYLSPFATCVTASGETAQAGGALFIDLPANMLGSFMLGIMTPIEQHIPDIPWLKQTHPLQSNTSIHTAIRTGFCGSLTTFSSWNTQMITMIVGTGTVRGVQFVPALMGYFLGTVLAISSFLFGRQFANALYEFRHPNGESKQKVNTPVIQDIESNDDQSSESGGVEITPHDPKHFTFENKGVNNDDNDNHVGCFDAIDCVAHGKYSPMFFALVLFIFFIIIDGATGSIFDRILWVMYFISPFGTIIRWKLSSTQNGTWFKNSEKWKHLPVGTLICNIAACVVSAICSASLSRVSKSDHGAIVILQGLKIGFAGNLSTVSTFVKEIVHLSENEQTKTLSHIYAVGTIVICCCFSIIFYAPIRV